MNTLFARLPALDPAARPEFTDARTCKHWMQLLPLINVSQSQLELREMLVIVNTTPIPPLERLRILEVMRDTVGLMQGEVAKKVINRPSPLFPGEQRLWSEIIGLWQAMADGYLIVLQAAREGDATVTDFTPLIHERVLRNYFFILREHAAIYAQRPPELLTTLHQLYRAAEESGYASNRVKDSQYRLSDSSSCEAAYIHALLLESVNPNMMAVKQLYWIDRLLERWSQHAQLWPEPVADHPYFQLGVNLEGSRPFQAGIELAGLKSVRYLDSARLGLSLIKRVRHLRQGETPAQLGLGEEFTSDACINGINYMFQQWCETGAERTFQRYEAHGSVEVATHLDAIHCLTTGVGFSQPERSETMSSQASRDLALFGHVSSMTQKKSSEPLEHQTEIWDILDQSAMGCRLGRSTKLGARISHNQLFGVKINKTTFTLGSLRWLSVGSDQLMVGIALLPGVPQAVAVRSTGLSPTGSNKYIPALLLPAVPALKIPETLFLPPGWFKPLRVIEFYAAPMPRRIRVGELLERGPDYERITFVNI